MLNVFAKECGTHVLAFSDVDAMKRMAWFSNPEQYISNFSAPLAFKLLANYVVEQEARSQQPVFLYSIYGPSDFIQFRCRCSRVVPSYLSKTT